MIASICSPERAICYRARALLVGQLRVEQQLGHADHAVHRRADLVAHVREERRLHVRGLDRCVARDRQLGVDPVALLLGLDLSGHIAGDPKRADDLAVLVTQRHLRRRYPRVGAILEGFALGLRAHRLTGVDHPLLIDVRGLGVRLAEDVEVGLADYVRHGAPMREPVDVPLTDGEKPALEVLEVEALLGVSEQVSHAQALDLLASAVLGWLSS